LSTAGAGKTFLSSIVIDHLLDANTNDGVAYLYFGYKDQTRQRPIDVMSIFTKQLLNRLPELPPDIEALYDEKGTESLDAHTLRGLLFSMPKRFSSHTGRAFIVCDALDEMDEYKQRDVLLPLLHDLENNGFDIFLTSRPHPADVRESFHDAIQVDITPDPKDLRAYVHEKLNDSTRFKKVIENSVSLALENIVSTVVSSAEGM
jgi:hypothetical protein